VSEAAAGRLAIVLSLFAIVVTLGGIADAIDHNTERCAPTAQER
jgi:hypothetical protein